MGVRDYIRQILQIAKLGQPSEGEQGVFRGLDQIRAPIMWPFGLFAKPTGGRGVIAHTTGGAVAMVVTDEKGRPEIGTGDVAIHNAKGTVVILRDAEVEINGQTVLIKGQLTTVQGGVMIQGATVAGGGLSVTGGFSAQGANIPLPGATGTFQDKNGVVVTVVNGIITQIG